MVEQLEHTRYIITPGHVSIAYALCVMGTDFFNSTDFQKAVPETANPCFKTLSHGHAKAFHCFICLKRDVCHLKHAALHQRHFPLFFFSNRTKKNWSLNYSYAFALVYLALFVVRHEYSKALTMF